MSDTVPAPGRGPLDVDEDYLMTRKEASAYAAALGIPLAVNTLAKFVGRDDGPPRVYFGRRPLYRVSEFRAWLHSRQRRT